MIDSCVAKLELLRSVPLKETLGCFRQTKTLSPETQTPFRPTSIRKVMQSAR